MGEEEQSARSDLAEIDAQVRKIVNELDANIDTSLKGEDLQLALCRTFREVSLFSTAEEILNLENIRVRCILLASGFPVLFSQLTSASTFRFFPTN